MNAEKGVTSTVMACCIVIRNFVILKGKRKKPELCDQMPPGIVVEMSYSDYMNSELFTLGLQHFI
jgi:hypothetical protein